MSMMEIEVGRGERELVARCVCAGCVGMMIDGVSYEEALEEEYMKLGMRLVRENFVDREDCVFPMGNIVGLRDGLVPVDFPVPMRAALITDLLLKAYIRVVETMWYAGSGGPVPGRLVLVNGSYGSEMSGVVLHGMNDSVWWPRGETVDVLFGLELTIEQCRFGFKALWDMLAAPGVAGVKLLERKVHDADN